VGPKPHTSRLVQSSAAVHVGVDPSCVRKLGEGG
jgi:hypothetical protein